MIIGAVPEHLFVLVDGACRCTLGLYSGRRNPTVAASERVAKINGVASDWKLPLGV